MKKFLLFITILAGGLSFSACSDNDNASSGSGESSDREFMTMFRSENITGKSSDPYACGVVTGTGLGETEPDNNAIHLYWYGVNGCKGYQVRIALQPNVSGGADAWEETYQSGKLVLDTIVGPNVLDMIIPDLQYTTDYRAAIRVLSNKDADGDYTHASNWYGHGNGRQWAEYLGITTLERYDVPEVMNEAKITKTSFRLNLTPKLSEFTSSENESYKKNFNTVVGADGDERYDFTYLKIEASATNPDAVVPDEWQYYKITDQDFANGYIDIDGLDQNSVYTVNVVDPKIESEKCFWDAIYNTLSIRTDGDPGEPIILEHSIVEPQRKDYLSDESYNSAMVQYNAQVEYNACRIDTVIDNYNSDNSLAEGQIFYLEGGKNYVLFNNTSLCKGLTLATNPEDVAKGLRAKVFMGGISIVDGKVSSMNFMFGRQPESGELGGIYIKSLVFENIDFDAPLCKNFGLGNGSAQGNYFINMYSNGMAVTMQSFEMRNCTIQRAIRGFIRVQGSKRKWFEKVLVEDCEFYNDGYYDNNGRGYAWVAGDGNNAKSNIFANMIFQNNTFYDSPRTAFFTDNGKSLAWPATTTYNITFNNNTVVNFSTRSSGRNIFDLRYLPVGSTLTCKNNLFIMAKRDGDTRKMYFQGMDVRTINGAPYTITYDFANNWCTNSNLNKGSIFTGQAFSAKKNAAGKNPDWNLQGADELEVHVADISNEDLMYDPNPPYISDQEPAYMHSTGYLDGTKADDINTQLGITKGVNLYFKNFDNDIVKNNAGASKWRTK